MAQFRRRYFISADRYHCIETAIPWTGHRLLLRGTDSLSSPQKKGPRLVRELATAGFGIAVEIQDVSGPVREIAGAVVCLDFDTP